MGVGMIQRIVILVATGLFASAAQAGAWLQPKGDGLVIGQATYYTTAKYFDAEGTLQRQSRFAKYELQPYIEYGLLDNLTLGGSAYAQRDTQAGGSDVGIADPELFARTTLWKGERQLVSIQPLIKLRSQFQSNNPPRGGSTSTDEELSLLYGLNINLFSPRDYLDASAAYRVRSGRLNDQWRAGAALGLQVADQWQIIPAIHMITSTGPKDSASFTENGDMDYDLLKLECTGIYQLDQKRWLQASLFHHAMGRQTGGGSGLSLGYAQRF